MHITTSKTLSILFLPLIKLTEYLGVNYPEFLVNLRYLFRFKRFPRLKNPRDLNEKILYLKLNTDTSRWTLLADKYKVREYIKECDLEEILIPLYGVWSNADDINFNLLPKKYILKANNGDGKGSFKVVRDNYTLNQKEARDLAKEWLSLRNIGALGAEPQYRDIPPKVLAEALLEPSDGSSLIDYKIWCFNGEPCCIVACSDRSVNKVTFGIYDLEWNWIPDALRSTSSYPTATFLLKSPEHLDQMLDIARKLSNPFPQVRVDLYEVEGKIYFGELTFTSLGGMMNYFTPEYLLKMGEKIDLNYGNTK